MGKDFPGSNIVGDYILRKKLRETSLSTVWKADHTTTGEAVALKQIAAAKLTSHLRNCLDCELAFLSSVNHPDIIRLLDFFQCQEFIILIMEFCEGGDLASFIRRHGRVQERLAKRFMQQLGAGLQVLKQSHIVHRDLKPETILMSGFEYDPVLKIADFGLSSLAILDMGSGFYFQMNLHRQYVDLHFTWLQKSYSSRDTTARLICGVLEQFFLNFLMAILHFMAGVVSSFCRISRSLHLFRLLLQSFHSCILIVLTCAHGCYPFVQMIVCPLRNSISTIF